MRSAERRLGGVKGRAGGAMPQDAARARRRRGDGILPLQRSRLLSAALGLVCESGYGETSVAAICARAGVSRRTFYELFEDREACMVAVLIDTEARIERTIAGAGPSEGTWRERIRTGLWTLLGLAAGEPVLAWACLCEFRRMDGPLAEEWQRIVARLTAAVDEGRMQSARSAAGPLTAEALVGAIAAVLARRVCEARGEPQPGLPGELLGELMSMIVLPYLGAGAARRELTCSPPSEGVAFDLVALSHSPDPLAGISVRMTYRTARVLQATAELAGNDAGASNRQIAEHAGVADAGQISKLLARLERHGLIANAAEDAHAKGEANSWRLADPGQQLLRGLGVDGRDAEARRRPELQPQAKEPSVGRAAARHGVREGQRRGMT